jgi:hypothetical protein
MKAIYIPTTFDPISDLKKLNDELKNTYSVEYETKVNDSFDGRYLGSVLILNDITRTDKLKTLNKISEK